MVVDRRSQSLKHARFWELPRFLLPEDLLVVNDTRVFPARLHGRRNGSRTLLEVLLLRRRAQDVWEALVRPGKRARQGDRLIFQKGNLEAEVLESPPGPVRRLRFKHKGEFEEWLEKLGEMPLPPYIHREVGEKDGVDRERYQTSFARVSGSIAAPTAGLHFTSNLMSQLAHCAITLHVGYGTFQPIRVQMVEKHRMEAEFYEVGGEAAGRLREHLSSGRRVVAVGSTSSRVLESVLAKYGQIVAAQGWTDLFIYPGYEFKVVGGLITNFHLPKSSLLLLVSAFAGLELVRECYQEAIRHGYRFYSYGDAMLIL